MDQDGVLEGWGIGPSAGAVLRSDGRGEGAVNLPLNRVSGEVDLRFMLGLSVTCKIDAEAYDLSDFSRRGGCRSHVANELVVVDATNSGAVEHISAAAGGEGT